MIIDKLFLPRVMLTCLISTLLIELLVAKLFKIKNKKDFINIILVNIVTNPLVVTIPFLINITYGSFARHIVLLALEILTVLFEGYIYKKYLDLKKLNPFLLSFILNLSSYVGGEIINLIIY